MMTIAEAHRHAREALAAAGVDSPGVDAWWLLEAATGLRRSQLVIERTRGLAAGERAVFTAALARRLQGEPVQHIVGQTEFYGYVLEVDARALVPRPETERLVELALERLSDVAEPHVLDVGTGSGAIAVAIGGARPSARIMATDVSPDALELAERNALRHGVPVRLERSHLLASPQVAAFARSADMIVTNLPYLPNRDQAIVSPEVGWDPEVALYGGESGAELFLELLAQARPVLPAQSWLLAELDRRNVRHALAEATAGGWRHAEIALDLTGRERFALLRPGSKEARAKEARAKEA